MTKQKVTDKTKDFLWKTDKNNWHYIRGEAIMKKYGDKIRPLEGNDPWTFVDFLIMSSSHMFFACMFANYLGGDQYWKLALIGWWFGGYWAVAGGLAIHEAAH